MKSLVLMAALGLGTLGLVGLTPSSAHASWLSEALHARYGPVYYDGYYAPAYAYPGYAYPSYSYYNYYTPYYQPGVSFYWGSTPRHYHNAWNGRHEERHESHGRHYHR